MQNTIPNLVMEIIADAYTLLKQEITLAKDELRGEIRKALTATIALATAVAVAAIGALLLILMVVHLLNAVTDLPMWACYGLVGTSLVAIGMILLVMGLKRFRRVHLMPVRALKTLKENVQWFKAVAISSGT